MSVAGYPGSKNNNNLLMHKKLKLFVCAFFLAEICLMYTPASAATVQPTPDYSTSGVQTGIETYLCAPTKNNNSGVGTGTLQGGTGTYFGGSGTVVNANAGDLYNCINKLYRFAIVISGVLGMFFIVIAGYVYMNAAGNQESIDKAKNMFTSTITAIVILFAGYILLRALNPDLIQFQPIQPPSVVPPSLSTSNLTVGGGGAPGAGGGVTTDAQTAAQTLISLAGSNKISINNTGCDCPGNCAINTLQSIAAGNKAVFDGPGSTCNAGSTAVSSAMLSSLITIANSSQNFVITSITGGHHSAAGDPHYQGRAVDLVPVPPSSQGQLVGALRTAKANTIALECTGGPNNGYMPFTGSNDNNGSCLNQPNYHIHAQWPQ